MNSESAYSEDCRERFHRRFKSADLILWTENHRLIKGLPWSWSLDTRDFSYMLPIYRDNSPEIIIKKSRQMAVSEYAINWLFWNLSRNPHTTGIHVFPNASQGQKFSKLRILPDNFRERIFVPESHRYKYADNVTHKHLINDSHYILSFIGGIHSKSTDARSISADFLVLDETKDLPQEDIADVEECLALSKFKMKRTIGTPDFFGTEFSKRWERSDQHEWVCSCKKCGHSAPLTFDFIQKSDSHYYGCPKCGALLDTLEGSWQPQNPDGTTRGYHVTQLMASWISASEIMKKKADYPPSKFANEVLGIEFEGAKRPISPTKLLNCCVTDVAGWQSTYERISIGVDWGNVSHYVILGISEGTYYLMDFGIWNDPDVAAHANHLIALVRAKYFAQRCPIVMDSGYGKAQNQIVFRAFPQLAWACFYGSVELLKPQFEIIRSVSGTPLNPTDYQYHVHIHHGSLCEEVTALLDEGKVKFWRGDDALDSTSALRSFIDNLSLIDVDVVDTSMGTRRKWVTTPAHYFMALLFAYVGLQRVESPVRLHSRMNRPGQRREDEYVIPPVGP